MFRRLTNVAVASGQSLDCRSQSAFFATTSGDLGRPTKKSGDANNGFKKTSTATTRSERPSREKWLVDGGRETGAAERDSFLPSSRMSSFFDDPFFSTSSSPGRSMLSSHFQEMQRSFDRMDRLFGEVENMFHQDRAAVSALQQSSSHQNNSREELSSAGRGMFSSRSVSTTSEIRDGKRYTKRITKVREPSGEEKENIEEFVTDLTSSSLNSGEGLGGGGSSQQLALPPPESTQSDSSVLVGKRKKAPKKKTVKKASPKPKKTKGGKKGKRYS